MPDAIDGPAQMGNPDASQDKELIVDTIREEVGPAIEVIASRLKDLEEDLGEAKDLLMKFTQGLIESADGYKRSTLSEDIMGKYGKDIEPLDGFYKDTMGKSFSDSILDELMGEGAPDESGRDEWMKSKLNDAKGKYGKYLGITVTSAPSAEKESPAEAAAEAKHPELEAAESPEKQAKEMKNASSASDKMAEKLLSLSGAKRGKLSGPIQA